MADEVLDPPAVVTPPAADPKPADPAPKAADPAPVADPAADPKPSDDWRSEWAGEDKDLLGFLGRYQSRDAAIKAFKTDRDAIRSGKYIKPVGEDATDEEKATYRKTMGVPDKPEGYLEKLPDGLVIGDDDRPNVDLFLTKMHEAGARKGDVDAALTAYYELVDAQTEAQTTAAAEAKRNCEDTLRQEWGPEYRRNDNVLQSYVGALPEAVRDAFDKGVGPDGIPIGFNPAIRQWLVAQALEANPLATVVPGAGNQAQAIGDEIATIEALMANQNSKYWKGSGAEKMQARYRELITARDKLK